MAGTGDLIVSVDDRASSIGSHDETTPLSPTSQIEAKIATKLTPEENAAFLEVAKRPDPDCPWPGWVSSLFKVIFCPLYCFHKVCPLRYYTSWSLLSYLIWFPCYFAIPFSNYLVRGALWEWAMFIAPASTLVFVLSPSVPIIFAKIVGWPLLMFVHIVIHILPLILLVTLTSVPHPIPFTSTLLFAATGIAYLTVLWVYWRAHPLTNYAVEKQQYINTIIAWAICWIGSVILCEFLFAYA